MTSTEFKEMAKTEDTAFVRLLQKDALIFMQWSDSEECWDYYIYDTDETYRDGGQFEKTGTKSRTHTMRFPKSLMTYLGSMRSMMIAK